MSEPVTVLVTTRDGTPVAVLDRISEHSLDLKINQAGVMSFTIPRRDAKAALLKLSSYVELQRGATRLRRGRVINREIDASQIYVSAMTEEGLLLDHRVPAQYGQVLIGLDLADAIRKCLNAWHPFRVKWEAEWAAWVASSQIATETFDNGVLLLGSNATPAYHSSGYAIFQFNAGDVPNFAGWDRIRWVSDYEAPVYTSIQYRFGTTGTWLPDVTITTDDGVVVAGTVGGIPDRVGLGLGDNLASVLQVRCNLYTSDTTSPDPGGTTQRGVTPFFYALEVLARRSTGITSTGIPPSIGVTVKGVRAGDASSLEAIRAMCEGLGYAFTIDDLNASVRSLNAGVDYTDQPIITSEMEGNAAAGIAVNLEPGAATLTLTGLAPTVQVGSDTSVQPAAGTLAMTGAAPTVQIGDNIAIAPAAGALTMTGASPTINISGAQTLDIAYVQGNGATPTSSDLAVVAHLEGLGHTVTTYDHATSAPAPSTHDLYIVSSTVSSTTAGASGWPQIAAPLIIWESASYNDAGLFSGTNAVTSANSVFIEDATHALAAGLAAGAHTIATSNIDMHICPTPIGNTAVVGTGGSSGSPALAGRTDHPDGFRKSCLPYGNTIGDVWNQTGRDLLNTAIEWTVPAAAGTTIQPAAGSLVMTGAAPTIDNSPSNIYSTDFEEYALGVQPSDWTHHGSTNQSYTVEDIGGAEGKVLRGNIVAGGDANSMLTWNAIPNTADMEAVYRIRHTGAADDKDHVLLVRFVDASNHYRGDYVNLQDGTTSEDARRASKRIAGSHSVLLTSGITDVVAAIDAGDWYWIRTRINGDNLKVKLWLDADPEPAAWDLEVTDTDLTGQTGKAGIGDYKRTTHEVSYFAVALNGGTAPKPWTPREIGGLALWLDAADPDTITASAGAVSQWDDKSGNARHVSQATSADQPTTGTRTLNGLNILDFDGSNLATSAAATLTTGNTVFIVQILDTSPGTTVYFYDGFTSGNRNILYENGSGAYRLGTSVSNAATGFSSTFGAAEIHTAVFNGASSEARQNGVSSGAIDPGTDDFDLIVIGIGRDQVTGPIDGAIAEFIVYDSVLTAAQIDEVEAYLAAKWGITI